MIEPLPGDIFRKGQVLNNTYEIEGVLGRGGTGEVYRARNQITGRVVALKALNRAFSANDAYIELMKREEEMRAIASDAVVRYTDCSRSAEGHVYLVMDYVDGTPLSDWLEAGGADPGDLMTVARRVSEGLVATHARNIVHRDLSPDNIILRGGDPGQAVIIDFGIAKDANAGARTIVGDGFAGKYEYAAPEQMNGHAEPRSDLYALGALLLATFRGQVPDAGGSPGAIVASKQRPLDTGGVPEPLRGLIERLADPDPARRPPSAAAVLSEIDALGKPSPERGKPERGKPAPEKGRRSRWPLAAAVLLVAALAGLGWWLARPGVPPVARPYVFTAERTGDGAARLSGDVPDAAAGKAVAEAFAAATGATPEPDALTLASGQPVADWGAAVAALITAAAPLEEWRLDVSDRDAGLVGVAPDATGRAAVEAGFASAATGAGLVPHARIATGPLRLTPAMVEAAVKPLADCGPLIAAPPSGGDVYPMGAEVAVRGSVASDETRRKLGAALAGAIGDRVARAEPVVLNPAICGVAGLLPAVSAGTGSISVGLGFGGRDEKNLTGIYATGDNPVIDVLLPAEPGDGHLWVVIADVTGNLYNLLPRLSQPATAVADLGTVAGGVRRVRVAYGEAEARADPASRLSFRVDDTFGKSLVIVFRTDRPLFDTLRPTTETIASFAADLDAVLREGRVTILAVATQLLDTRE
ncbi:serine/threonine-protein kinase [Amaricoccus solimangrovi]|uniref:Serine/threonine protein kinase n=1 Tax=Amaricoccus solimangrovi TaxID=2589815 RepID=A0A501WJY8_9RHOB|nr:serine/threonine-protein kinase [Amaricoccus solimangrovi]TPE49092.1 serine/threonine protein kinase [Amaricoccus solimangrovi]